MKHGNRKKVSSGLNYVYSDIELSARIQLEVHDFDFKNRIGVKQQKGSLT